MNKKGFTILELVVVFVLIVVLAGLGIVSYKALTDKAEVSYYNAIEGDILLSGNSYFQEHRDELPVNSYSAVSLGKLIDDNYIDPVKDKNGNLCTDGNVYVYRGENKGYEYEVCLKCGDYESSGGKYCKPENSGPSVMIPTNSLCKRKKDATYIGRIINLTTVISGRGYTLSGYSQMNANEDGYVITAKLEEGYRWNDNTVEDKTFKCSLYKATPEIVLSNTRGLAVVGNETKFREKSNVGGKFVNTSHNSDVAIVTGNSEKTVTANSENEVTIKGLSGGKTEIKVMFTPADTNNYKTVRDIGYSVTVSGGINKPTEAYCEEELVYNGKEQELTKETGEEFIFINNKGINAGEYEVIARLQDGNKWEDNSEEDVKINCQIKKREVAIIVDNKIMTYGGEVPTYSYLKAGEVNGESAISGTINYTIKDTNNNIVTVNETTNVGTYTIEPSGGTVGSNYELKYINGTLDINKAKAVITCDDKTYTGSAQTIASCSGGTVGNASQTDYSSIGYKITCTGDANHTDAENKTCYINKADAVLTCTNRTYTGGTLTLYTEATGCSSVTNGEKTAPGTYTLTCNPDNNHNAPSTCSASIINPATPTPVPKERYRFKCYCVKYAGAGKEDRYIVKYSCTYSSVNICENSATADNWCKAFCKQWVYENRYQRVWDSNNASQCGGFNSNNKYEHYSPPNYTNYCQKYKSGDTCNYNINIDGY